MPSAVWSGHLHFGLVVMPVRLLVAARTKTIRFRRIHRKPANGKAFVSFSSFPHDHEDNDSGQTSDVAHSPFMSEEMNDRGAPAHQYSSVRQVFRSEATGQEIPEDEMVKGYEIAPNEFAVIHPEEIRAAKIVTSDTIDLFHFVQATEVDPIYFERSYYVAPHSGAEKGYVLLLEAMRREECLGIARIGMHGREHMLILRPSEGYLVAYTMYYANEVRSAPRVELTTEFGNKELSMATALIKAYEGTFDPQQFKNLYQERIRKIIEAQVDHSIEMVPPNTILATPAPNLMEQIRLSLAQVEAKKSSPTLPRKPARSAPTGAKKRPRGVRA